MDDGDDEVGQPPDQQPQWEYLSATAATLHMHATRVKVPGPPEPPEPIEPPVDVY